MGPARELAPSQITASTVVQPEVPPPCELADLDLWTAQVLIRGESADAVIRVLNQGADWCEPDIYGSPQIDPLIEPDVWLDPGGWADLVVGPSGEGCDERAIVGVADVDIHGEVAPVPTAAIQPCGWRLTAFYPIDPVAEPCGRLTLADVAGFVVVRNSSTRACALGPLAEVDGNAASTTPRPSSGRETDAVEVIDLAPGDVVGFRYTLDASGACADEYAPGVLIFDIAGVVPFGEVACAAAYEAGPGRPWYGDPNGPLAPFPTASFDLDRALTALDPFRPPQ